MPYETAHRSSRRGAAHLYHRRLCRDGVGQLPDVFRGPARGVHRFPPTLCHLQPVREIIDPADESSLVLALCLIFHPTRNAPAASALLTHCYELPLLSIVCSINCSCSGVKGFGRKTTAPASKLSAESLESCSAVMIMTGMVIKRCSFFM